MSIIELTTHCSCTYIDEHEVRYLVMPLWFRRVICQLSPKKLLRNLFIFLKIRFWVSCLLLLHLLRQPKKLTQIELKISKNLKFDLKMSLNRKILNLHFHVMQFPISGVHASILCFGMQIYSDLLLSIKMIALAEIIRKNQRMSHSRPLFVCGRRRSWVVLLVELFVWSMHHQLCLISADPGTLLRPYC